MSEDRTNATFHSFKESGKWYATGRGILAKEVFSVFTAFEQRETILKNNDGKFPGLSTAGRDFFCVIIADENVDFGYPLMLCPL